MTAALDGAQRTALSNVIQKARSLLEADLASTLEGDFGIHHSDGRIEEADALSLDASQAAVRIDLLDIVAFLRSEGETEPAAVERLIREAAFTHVNRLVALRVAEGLGILPEAIGNGLASQGFRNFAEIAPASADEEWERFRLFVRICADELSADVPALFDPRNPLLELEPSTAAFSDLIEVFVAADKATWSAPDALGWSYQFFNSAEERKEMRVTAPENSRELAVRNQFFTPSYVVEFLVQNGLGAHLASSLPALAEELPMLVKVPEPAAQAVDLRAISALDPACGSGHFLLGAYDVLEAAWRLAGVEPGDAAPDIVRSLWGIDIDPRATQIAQAAVIFRARRHCRAPLPKPNVICARSLPTGPEHEHLISSLPDHVGRVVRAIADELVMAPTLGSLLKIEQRLDRETRDAFGTGQVEGTLSEGMSDADAADVESRVLEVLSTIADHTTSTASQRLFAAEAHDAVRFVEAMSRRYTACVMNPPFGEPVATTKQYVKTSYPEVPKGAYLEAAFIDRSFDLLGVDGSVGVVSSRSPLFLSTFTRWRVARLLDGRLHALLDVGHGLMEQALVEAAAMVLHAKPSAKPVEAISLLRSQQRDADLYSAMSGRVPDSVDWFKTDVRPLLQLPSKPLCYWASEAQLAVWSEWNGLEETWCDVRVGSWPGDDFRHLRLWWEAGQPSIDKKEWVPYAKGGPYAPYYEEPHLLVDWDSSRGTFWDFFGRKGRPTSIPENRDYYRRPGLTWSRRTASGLSVRVLPSGSIFADKGPGMFAENDEKPTLLIALAWLNSRAAKALLDLQLAAGEETSSGSASRSYEVGLLRALPAPDLSSGQQCSVVGHCDSVLGVMMAQRGLVETSRLFDAERWASSDSLTSAIRSRYQEFLGALERLYASVGQIESVFKEVLPGDTDWVDKACGQSIWGFRHEEGPTAELAADFALSEDALVDSALSSLGGARYLAVQSHQVNRRVELLCHLYGQSPLSVVSALRKVDPPDWFAADVAGGLISYWVGRSFRRWATPVHPPDDAFAEVEVPGHSEGPLVQTNEALCDLMRSESVGEGSSSDFLDAAAAIVDRGRNLPSYLSARFFADHLGRYSMSRRKAPIYWQLQVPSRKWSVWLYMPRLSREMLFAVVRETEQRQRLADQRVATLQREYDDGGAGRTIVAVSRELDAEQKLAVELVTFRDEAERIANLGWEPDLDDGAVLNAAPLASLFHAWKDAAKYRKELKQGKHTWSTVSKYADQL